MKNKTKINGASKKDPRFEGIVLRVCEKRGYISIAFGTLLLAAFYLCGRDYAAISVKVAGAMAIGTTLSGFMLGWVNDATKAVQEWTDYESAAASEALFKLQGQIISALRCWLGSVVAAISALVFCSWLERGWNSEGKPAMDEVNLWFIATFSAASLGLLVYMILQLYNMMENVMSQKFRIEHAVREYRRTAKKN